jgi:uncharacterized protein YjiS (DUF1127 family)
MMVPAKGWPACRIVQADDAPQSRVTCVQPHPRTMARAAPTGRGLAGAWSAVSRLWRQRHGRKDVMRALAEIPDDDLEDLSEAGQLMRREARLELAASERKSGCPLHALQAPAEPEKASPRI